jgi:hypothetical protein
MLRDKITKTIANSMMAVNPARSCKLSRSNCIRFPRLFFANVTLPDRSQCAEEGGAQGNDVEALGFFGSRFEPLKPIPHSGGEGCRGGAHRAQTSPPAPTSFEALGEALKPRLGAFWSLGVHFASAMRSGSYGSGEVSTAAYPVLVAVCLSDRGPAP